MGAKTAPRRMSRRCGVAYRAGAGGGQTLWGFLKNTDVYTTCKIVFSFVKGGLPSVWKTFDMGRSEHRYACVGAGCV